MRALYLIVPILGILVIAYRYYSVFISTRLWVLDDTRVTPAHVKNDGANFFQVPLPGADRRLLQ